MTFSKCTHFVVVVDATNFTSQNSMDILGFEQDEKMDIYKIVAAVMHLGTMKFKQRGREEQADAEGTKVCISFFSFFLHQSILSYS